MTGTDIAIMDITFRYNRPTVASRFWTVPAHRTPLGRRMAAAGIVR